MSPRRKPKAATVEELQLQVATEQRDHLRELRKLEIRKAEVELDTAEIVNDATRKHVGGLDLPRIKPS